MRIQQKQFSLMTDEFNQWCRRQDLSNKTPKHYRNNPGNIQTNHVDGCS